MELQYNIYSRKFLFPAFFLLCKVYFTLFYKYNYRIYIQNSLVFFGSVIFGINTFSSDLTPHLENCFQLCRLINELNTKIDGYIEFLETEKSWFGLGLEADLEAFEVQLDAVQNLIIDKYYITYANQGYYTFEQKQTFLTEIWNHALPSLNDSASKINSKKEKLISFINETVTEASREGKTEWLESVVVLHQSGIRMSKMNPNETCFDPELLEELYKLFAQLQHEQLRDDGYLSAYELYARMIHAAWRFVFSFSNFSLNFKIVDLQMNQIPAFLSKNEHVISNFFPWVAKQNNQMAEKKSIVFKMIKRIQEQAKRELEILGKKHEDVLHSAAQVNVWPVLTAQDDIYI